MRKGERQRERERDRWTGSLGKGPKGIGEAYEQIQDLSMRMGRRDEGKPWRCRVGAGLVPLTTSRRGRLQIVTLGRLGFETAPVLKNEAEELLSAGGNGKSPNGNQFLG